jgi:hypothetical protein
MADVKISGLPASTTPLAGTEVLPIVQGGATKQVSVDNLTTGKSVSATNFIPSGAAVPTNGMYLPAANTVGFATNSTEDMRLYASGGVSIGNTTDPGASVLSITTVGKVASLIVTDTDIFGANIRLTGNGATTPSKTIRASGGNFEVVNSGYGGVPLSLTDAGNLTVTGNFVVGTSGKGIDFSATAGTGTSELLADYEEGTWTPSVNIGGSSAGITYSTQAGKYTKIGRLVTVEAAIALTSKGVNTGTFVVAGMPFTSFGNAGGGSLGTITDITYSGVPMIRYFSGGTTFAFVSCTEAGATNSLTDANLANNSYMQFTLTYSV